MHFDIGLGVNGVRETGKLRNPAKIRDQVLVDLPGTGGLTDVFKLLVVGETAGEDGKVVNPRR